MTSKQPKTVKITVNGVDHNFREGLPLLQELIENNLMVPHFCYHPGMGVRGSCRLCMVDIEGSPKVLTSCTVSVKEGLIVNTNSEKALLARKGVLEFILLNHPLDCPFCDKGGECPLQNYTLDSGQFTTRFEFEKRHKAKHQVIGEHIILDKERCVLCDRCVRFGQLLAGHEELQVRNRGSKNEIFVPDGEQLQSQFTGNYADFCPVGALTSRHFRFQARPWEMKRTNTLCAGCSLGCNIQAWTKKAQVLRLTPRVEPDVNEWWLCDRGRFGFSKYQGTFRMIHPRKRERSDFLKITAIEAITEVSMKLKQAKSLAIITDAQCSNEELFLMKELVKKFPFGRIFTPLSAHVQSFYNKLQTYQLEATFPDHVDTSSEYIVLGEVLEDNHPILALRLRRNVRERSGHLIQVNDQRPEFMDIGASYFNLKALQAKDLLEQWDGYTFDSTESWRPKAKAQTPQTTIFIAQEWLDSTSPEVTDRWLSKIAQQSNIKIHILLNGSNIRGVLDQWESQTFQTTQALDAGHQETFDVAINLGGKRSVKAQYLVDFVFRVSDADKTAQVLLPWDSPLEKDGTYTNMFGRVQRLRPAVQVNLGGTGVHHLLSSLLTQMGSYPENLTADAVYQQLASKITKYSSQWAQIPESTLTYHHYERASWR